MRRSSIVQLCLLVVLLAATSDGFFFEYPKKAIVDFFQSFKEKKDAKKKPYVNNNIRHYHVHYYPQQIHVLKTPESYELDANHRDDLHSLGWSVQSQKSASEPRFSISSLYESWNQVQGPWSWNKGTLERGLSKASDRTENQGILVRIPIHQQIVVQQPHSTESLRTSLLATFFQKLGQAQSADSYVTI